MLRVRACFIIVSLLALIHLRSESGTNAPFSIQQRDGISWLTKPNGEGFFSVGVCVVNQGASRENFNPTNPAYAAFQHYEDSNRWAEATLNRLKSWKFTTVGGWSDFAALRQCRDADVAFIPVLAVGMTCGAPWLDMWDTNLVARMHQIARDKIVPLLGEPRVLGYYTDNEMGWWNATLFKMTLEQPPSSGQRQRLMQLLRETYHSSWPELLKDFEAERAGSFTELDKGGMLWLRPGSRGIRTYRRFLGLMAERYYSLVREIIRTYDSRGLVLGDRYQSFYYPEVARASGPFLDAASSNLNAAWNDGTFPRFYLETLHALVGKPILVSEFYAAAQENRSGNQNKTSTFPTLTTQAQRAASFRNTLQALARMPYVIGADWFQFCDEPPHGREDGEDYNFGLVDIHDQPYEPLTSAASALDVDALRSGQHPARLDASLGVPPAPVEPLGQFTIGLALQHWDRERGFVKPVSDFPVADLYVCWSKQAMYLGLYAQDIVEVNYYPNKSVPELDRAEWVVAIGESRKPIHIRLGPGASPLCDDPAARIVNLSGVYMNTRNIAAVELPAKMFGRARFESGDSVEFTSTFFTHCRAERVEWKARFTLKQ
jgi:hypothetical protein